MSQSMNKMLVANWKSHGSKQFFHELTDKLLTSKINDTLQVVLLPPFPYIDNTALQLAQHPRILLGAQDVSDKHLGAYTGAVDISMLADMSCKYVLVGHSERRQHFGETEAVIADKYQRVIAGGLSPILCVGEDAAAKRAGNSLAVVIAQLNAIYTTHGSALFSQTVIAYEPVWAIGTGASASLPDILNIFAEIKNWLESKGVFNVPLLYGGSVNEHNANEILSHELISGVLVGGASLEYHKFNGIIQCIN